MKKSLLPLFFAAVLFTSCMGPKSLQRQINRTAYEPVMIYDSEIASEKSDQKVAFDFINESGLPAESTVIKNDGHFLYLILFYTYDYDMTVKLGENASDPSATNIVKNALYGTVDRSGAFNRIVETETTKADYKSVVTLKEVDISCKYYRKGMAFGATSTDEVRAEKSIGKVVLNLKLYDRSGAVILEKDYTENGVTEFATSTTKYNEVRKMAMKNLIENLTVSSQSLARAMTYDINKALKSNTSLTKI